MGGGGPKRTPRLAAQYADEFNVGFRTFEETLGGFERVRAAAGELGRDPGSIVLSIASTTVVGKDDAEVARRAEASGVSLDWLRTNGYVGSPAQVVDTLGRFAQAGVTRVYLQIQDMSDLDHLELIAAQVAPQLS